VVRALDRKLLRDLRLMWSQALTIALVVASGVGGFITSLSAVDSLALARDRFYAQGRFADVFASREARAERPRRHAARGGRRGGRAGDPRADGAHRDPGLADPIIGQLIGLDRRHPHRMNRVTVVSGRTPGDAGAGGTRSDGSLEALVSEAFAQAHHLRPGSTLAALINGKRRTLVMTGTALSPEFIFAGLWGMPDARGFGVFWIDRDALAAAYDMQGAFNRVALKLAPGASEQAAIDGVRGGSRPTAGAKRMDASTSRRTPCSTTRSGCSRCSGPCCPPSSSAWPPSS
jgi:putative ABC transport system permease protein